MEDAAHPQETEYGIPIRNVWHMLLYAWNELPHTSFGHFSDSEVAPTLDALLATILVRTMQQRLRIGLGSSYMPEARLLRGVRGRIQFSRSLAHRAFDKGQAYCEFENFTVNAPKNQVVRSTLQYLARVGQFGPDRKKSAELRHAVRLLVRQLDTVDLIELTPEFVHRVQFERHDRDYRLMLAICDFILQRRLPQEYEGRVYSSRLDRERLVLHTVFEKFVANFYRACLREWVVTPQKRLYWHGLASHAYLPTMLPDVQLVGKATGKILILDTKFTARSLIKNQEGSKRFVSSHLYQLYAYLRTQEHLSAAHGRAEGILLYPTAGTPLAETIELPQHTMYIESVDLAAPWPAVEQRLLDVILEKS